MLCDQLGGAVHHSRRRQKAGGDANVPASAANSIAITVVKPILALNSISIYSKSLSKKWPQCNRINNNHLHVDAIIFQLLCDCIDKIGGSEKS